MKSNGATIMKCATLLIALAIMLAWLATAQADVVCTQHGGCRETGKRIILVDPSFTSGQYITRTDRNGKKVRIRVDHIHWDN
jgi:hypothetical protein